MAPPAKNEKKEKEKGKGKDGKDKDEKKDEKEEKKEEPVKPKRPPTLEEMVIRNVSLLEKAVETNQARLVTRTLRYHTPIRTKVTPPQLCAILRAYLPEALPLRAGLLAKLEALPEQVASDLEAMEIATATAGGGKDADAMDVDGKDAAAAALDEDPPQQLPATPMEPLIPEIELYLSTLVVTTLLRFKEHGQAFELAEAAVERLKAINRRTCDALSAKLYFYYAHAAEHLGPAKLTEIRPALLAAHRTACLRHNEQGQATLLNLLLRSLLHFNQVEQAYKLVSKTNYPESASNNQFCRYLYYTGRIQALQLDYTDAYTKLMQSQRKAPGNTASGFRVTVQKLMVIVQLLMGELPERSAFNFPGDPAARAALDPYLQLTQAVRRGSLEGFEAVVKAHAGVFRADHTHTLVIRLGQNVVKTGLRKISLSYSRISFADVAGKLALDSAASAEFVCAKAIKDGVIDAELDHDTGCMASKDVADIYQTDEPQKAFHRRIIFCLDVRNEAVKAMRYPPDAYKKKEKPKEGDDDKTEEEIAKEIEEELEDEGL